MQGIENVDTETEDRRIWNQIHNFQGRIGLALDVTRSETGAIDAGSLRDLCC